MKATFLGAAHEVTGSCTLLECAGSRGLVDCGMEQGKDLFVNRPIPVPAAELDYVLLTHAHVDHSGHLPLLYKQGYSGLIYATPETCNLCRIMLLDCAQIHENEAEYANRKNQRSGKPPVQPLFTVEDAEHTLTHMRPVPYGETVQVAEGVTVRFNDVAHLLGSACIEIWLSENGQNRKMVFSGDVGNYDQPIIRNVPQKVEEADYVVVESTYGDRLHDRKKLPVDVLADYIQRTLDRGGNVIIPSFAVGRTQEMLYFIREIKEKHMVTGHDGFPVYVDSPMASEATGIYLQCSHDCLDEETAAVIDRGINPLWSDGVRFSVSTEESKALNFDTEPKVILAASGMCEGGRIRHHLKHNLWRPESTVLFVGYQSVGTLGRIIVDGAESVKLFGEEIKVNCEIGTLPGKSGHADRDGLIDWLRGFTNPPKKVIVNHGENTVTDLFADFVHETLGFSAYAPYSGASLDLLSGEFLSMPEGESIKKTAAATEGGSKAEVLYHKLQTAGEQLMKLINATSGKPNKTLEHFLKDVESLIRKYK
ncbi:MAG: MBL fold metallo-hydrolase [Oscillospiraceae bacterium]|nr:MBL fold metallo-hydrolase [Oscillospiraceae bacterium]